MSKPTGKLAFAYHTISVLEEKVARLEAALANQPATGTTSDKYRAELYDEVWQKAREMGYINVTMALVALERLEATPPAAAHGDELVAVVGTVPDGSGFKSLDFKVELQGLPDGTRLCVMRAQAGEGG